MSVTHLHAADRAVVRTKDGRVGVLYLVSRKTGRASVHISGRHERFENDDVEPVVHDVRITRELLARIADKPAGHPLWLIRAVALLAAQQLAGWEGNNDETVSQL